MFSAFQNLTQSRILAMVMVDHQDVLKVAPQQHLFKKHGVEFGLYVQRFLNVLLWHHSI